MRRITIFAVALLSTMANAFAQESDVQTKENVFGVSAQIRSRAEYRNGVLSPRRYFSPKWQCGNENVRFYMYISPSTRF